tara:strand:+ start:223 stop:411 length:189 start_codon:yes stop_codon:yes gene_type:complete
MTSVSIDDSIASLIESLMFTIGSSSVSIDTEEDSLSIDTEEDSLSKESSISFRKFNYYSGYV